MSVSALEYHPDMLNTVILGAVLAAPPSSARLPAMLVGADISSLAQMEAAQAVYRDQGQPKPLLDIMKGAGWNVARVRLWVNPNPLQKEVQDLAYVKALGKRIKDARLTFLLDLHYSDTWADPGKQFKPAAWSTLGFEALKTTVRDYTKTVLNELKAAGAAPDIVQTGNEITDGMLWPEGRISTQGWQPFLGLLKSAIMGVAESTLQPKPKVMIHIDRGADWPATQAYFQKIQEGSVNYDFIGLSYYPTYHGAFSAFENCLRSAAQTFSKPVLVAEVGYPYVASWFPGFQGEFPVTPTGQSDFLAAVMKAVRRVPRGRGLGVVYWEPGWHAVQHAGEWYGGWGQCLVDGAGNTLPG